MIEFLKEISQRQNTVHVLKQYDFHLGLEAGIRVIILNMICFNLKRKT